MALAIPRVDRKTASLRGRAYAILKQAILDGRLKPGENLVEEQLCVSLGISRTPLREALGRLEHEGLISTIPYKGTVVTPLTEHELRDIFQMREVLEALSLDLAWPHLTDDDLAGLAETFAELRWAITLDGDRAAHERSDWALHGLLVERGGNALLAKSLQGLHERVVRCQLGDLLGPERAAAHRRASLAEHLEIIAALQARQLAAAEAAMRAHVRAAAQRLLDGMRQRAATPG